MLPPVWWIYVVIWTSFAVLASLIAQWKNRPAGEGFVLGLFLGVFGAAIESLLPQVVPSTGHIPRGRYEMRCAVCNAVQNVVNADKSYGCWQCHQPTILRSADDDADIHGRYTVQCPSCDKQTKVKGDSVQYICECGSRNNLALKG